MPKNAGPTVHVKGRESKLPPKAQQSPASNFKGKAISFLLNYKLCKDFFSRPRF